MGKKTDGISTLSSLQFLIICVSVFAEVCTAWTPGALRSRRGRVGRTRRRREGLVDGGVEYALERLATGLWVRSFCAFLFTFHKHRLQATVKGLGCSCEVTACL